MSAFNNTQVLTMEAANLYCGSDSTTSATSNHLTITQLKLPMIDEQYVEHRAGGAPVAIEIDTVIARLETSFSLAGWTPQVAELVSSWTKTQNKFTAYGVVRDRMSGTPYQAIASFTGRLGRADPENWQRGNLMHWNYMIKGLTTYTLGIGGENIYDWNFFTNMWNVGGVDRNADINTLLATGIASATAAPAGG